METNEYKKMKKNKEIFIPLLILTAFSMVLGIYLLWDSLGRIYKIK